MNPIKRYTRWLHTQWPAGTVEQIPEVNEDASTNVKGLYITGDLTGVPLLKFAADSGPKAIETLLNDPSFAKRETSDDVVDVAIIGCSVSGVSAALEAQKNALSFHIFEATEPFSTIVNFPKAKPIFTYPNDMTPRGELQFHEKSDVKEGLLEDLNEQRRAAGIEPDLRRVKQVKKQAGAFLIELAEGDLVRAHRVIVGIGKSGNHRRLNVPGEDLDKVYNRLYDPQDFCGQNVLVVGGGDSALETAIALGRCGAHVSLSYRRAEFSRPKPENTEALNNLLEGRRNEAEVAKPSSERISTAAGEWMHEPPEQGDVRLIMPSNVTEVRADEVDLTVGEDDEPVTIPNDVVFTMIGREPPLDFFRRSNVKIRGEWTLFSVVGLAAFLLFCFWLYHWKSEKPVPIVGDLPAWLDPQPAQFWNSIRTSGGWLAERAADPSTFLGTLAISASSPAFYYTFAYSAIVVIFGLLRIRRRKTPYVTWQTWALMTIQVLPLFILPELILPLLGHNGLFDGGWLKSLADSLFPDAGYGHGREYWRAYGFILAWPLMAWNWFTSEPLTAWLVIGGLQTFVLIPLIIYYWGKGAYCGWICSCGALAETLGDRHRHKMPHGPFWNRFNMLGQGILLLAVFLMILRIIGWVFGPQSWAAQTFTFFGPYEPQQDYGLNYQWIVDLLLAGVLGYGLYFWFSGRMWCRFACPLAALMHIYARFSRFRILADKKKCISCNVCTSVCHQGIDVMNFANKGEPMADPECVRCSACVQMCPTGVLSFGQVDRKTGATISEDPRWLMASPVRIANLTVNGEPPRS